MGKSLKPLFDGTSDRVYGANEILQTICSTILQYTWGDWKTMKHEPPLSDGKWRLYNLANDPGQNLDVANQHPDILQKMTSAYEAYAKDVGVVIARGEQYAEALASTVPPLNNHSQVTITSQDIEPAHFSHEAPIED